MNFKAGNLYHVYNRGNNRQTIFFKHDNYLYFLRKVRKYMVPHCEIIAYVLMPNHFHFLIYADERSEGRVDKMLITQNVLSNGIRLLLSSFTKGINKQESKTGNLIQQKTKAKSVFDFDNPEVSNYAGICFHYIHNNPVASGFVDNIRDWEYSSYPDYAGLRNGSLCNKTLFPHLFQEKPVKSLANDLSLIF
jgi:putative transposase